MAGTGKDRERDAREQRLSAALRENLKRRKAQSRARSGAGPTGSQAPGAPADPPGTHDSAGIVTDKQSGTDG
ncbi:hypothetical protein J2S22_001005 [Rhodoplanes tepidamans]|nr:hypothetical protein [Rhodoplanes tepidamans]